MGHLPGSRIWPHHGDLASAQKAGRGWRELPHPHDLALQGKLCKAAIGGRNSPLCPSVPFVDTFTAPMAFWYIPAGFPLEATL